MTGQPAHPPTVAVWRTRWLPPSETFVRDHVTSLRRWRPLLLGAYRDGPAFDLDIALAPYRDDIIGRAARRCGYLGPHDLLLASKRPQLAHVHFGTDAVESLPLLRRHRLPMLVTFHGYDLLTAPNTPYGPIYLQRLRQVFNYADRLLPVSQFLADRLLELGAPADKVHVHYLGIPLPDVLPDPDSALRPPGDGEPGGRERPRRGITFVGRLTPGKGVADLLAAYAALPQSVRRSCPLTVIGDGPERADLQARARQIDGDITFAGIRPSNEVADALAAAQVFAAPSTLSADGWTEGLGLVFLEAARAGTPVVAYRTGGVPEVVDHGRSGLLAPRGDVNALGAHLLALLTDPVRAAAMGRAGQNRVRERFDLSERTTVLEDIYDDVLARRRAGVR